MCDLHVVITSYDPIFSGAQVRKPRLRERKDFVDIYTVLGDFPVAKW